MIDIILLAFLTGVFAGGFWCGKTYGSVGKMFEDLRKKF